MSKILFITYQFPPFAGSHSTRTLNIANELVKNNEVIVLTVQLDARMPFYDHDLLKKVDSKVKVLTSKMGFLHEKNYNKVSGNSKISNSKKNSKFFNYLKENKKKFLIPDTIIDWYFNAIKTGKEIIEKYEPDVILSSATPYTNHLVAYKLSKIFNLPLFLDYGDPWVYEQSVKRGRIRFYFEKKMESKILKQAKHLFVTTKNTKKLYEDKFKIIENKISIAYMGFDIEDFKDISKKSKKEKLEFIYGGSLNPIHRNPTLFFQAISKLPSEVRNNIKIELFSSDEMLYNQLIEDLGIKDIVEFRELVSHNKFMDLLQKKDVLILFGNSNKLQIPGKIFNYIGSLTNILLINNQKNIEEDETNFIVGNFKNNFTTENNIEKIQEEIKKIYNMWKNSKLTINSKEDSEKYSWSNTLKIFSEKIK
ncbi:hypothetical protein [Cetobacterium sp.]|uniref:hypothetical protein n=1 Tax=Cetobacterium sp. TaxID=2071632 RepID=UPI003F2F567B